MKEIKYAPDAADKLRGMKAEISEQYGKEKAKKILKTITGTIRNLCDNEEKCIRIINLYHEKEDFMWQLFGIDTTP